MVSRMLLFATFALIVWLTLQLSLLNKQVSALQQLSENSESQQQKMAADLLEAKKTSRTGLEDLSQKVNGVLAANKSNADNGKKLKAYQSKQAKTDTLRSAYILVLEAEAARIAKDGKTAQSKLAASKKLIWKSGSNYPKQKKSLQGLMKTIDITLGAWKSKNLSKDTKAIYSVIAKAIKNPG